MKNYWLNRSINSIYYNDGNAIQILPTLISMKTVSAFLKEAIYTIYEDIFDNYMLLERLYNS